MSYQSLSESQSAEGSINPLPNEKHQKGELYELTKEGKQEESAPSIQAQIGAAVFYGVSSLLIMFTNKIVLTSYGFKSYNFVALAQFAATVIILQALKMLGYVNFPSPSAQMVQRVFPIPLLFLVNAMSGLGGTKMISLPMFTVLRRFSIFLTMVFEYFVLGNVASSKVQFSVAMLIGGSLIAASDDLAFHGLGYTMITLNNICTALIGVVTKKKLNARELGTEGLLFYNSLVAAPLLVLLVTFLDPDELPAALNSELWSNFGFVCCMLLTSIMGLVLNWSLVLCTKINSALTTTIVGCLKNVFSTYVGMFLGGDYIFSLVNFVGINISVSGSIYYSWVKYKEQQSKKNSLGSVS